MTCSSLTLILPTGRTARNARRDVGGDFLFERERRQALEFAVFVPVFHEIVQLDRLVVFGRLLALAELESGLIALNAPGRLAQPIVHGPVQIGAATPRPSNRTKSRHM